MKSFKKLAGFSGFAVILLIVFEGCKKEPLNNLSNDESRIYVSNYDTAANFGSYRTFSLDDSVNIIEDDQLLGKKLGAYETNVLNTVRQMMQSRGYQLVDNDSKPDLAVNIAKVTSTSTGVFSYPDYWDSYGSFYDPYYWGYPGYGYYAPYMIGIYTIQSGGLEIDILDLKNAAANGDKIQVIWTGLARGEDVFNPGNGAAEVNALFNQSDYLKTTN
jgi:hypothetical protein